MNPPQIHPTARIDVDDLIIGDGSIIRAGAVLQGRKIHLGRETFIDEQAVIGGGSNQHGELVAGDWLHVGMYAQINCARTVHIGHEVGIGIGTKVFTHGAYLSEWDGFPVTFDDVTIGDRVWLPNAIVLPGVTIGSDVVVAAGSTVTSDLPAGCLAGGSPARPLRKDVYPNIPADRIDILERIINEADVETMWWPDEIIVAGGGTFNLAQRFIIGPVTENTERLRNQLRRHGIRFRYEPRNGHYRPWSTDDYR
jgi:acetyltransferase-like isoleucine patch superfamily enzyme